MAYIHIVQEREFRRSGEEVWKIGFTNREIWEHVKEYPKCSFLIMSVYV